MLFIDYPNKRRVFGIFYKSDLSITNAILLKNIFILTYFARIFMVYFLASDVTIQDGCSEYAGALTHKPKLTRASGIGRIVQARVNSCSALFYITMKKMIFLQ